jgi:hypothetical protein
VLLLVSRLAMYLDMQVKKGWAIVCLVRAGLRDLVCRALMSVSMDTGWSRSRPSLRGERQRDE